ncbi:MAG: YraN family protein [Cyclobacteriaceae bacterium]|nr:YraN family protein [Cyclobacteriaceae bacterium]
MGDNIKKGTAAEEQAARYLQSKGYEIVERNLRHGRSEIDLVVRKANWLVFVEVKMRTSVKFGYPEEFVDRQKARLITDGAVWYMDKINWKGNVRYDIVAITVLNGEEEIRHIEDAFY